MSRTIRGPKTAATLTDTTLTFEHVRGSTVVPVDAVQAVNVERAGSWPMHYYRLSVTVAGGRDRVVRGGVRDGMSFDPYAVVVGKRQHDDLVAFAAAIEAARLR